MFKNLSGLVKVIQPVKNKPKIGSESLKSSSFSKVCISSTYLWLAHIYILWIHLLINIYWTYTRFLAQCYMLHTQKQIR